MPEQERIALFIDGANLYATAKSFGFDIDYRKLLKEFQGAGRLIRAFYYTALVEDQEYSSIRPLIDWLDYNGYAVVTKPTKEFVDRSAAARSRATWTSSSRSMPWRWPSTSTTWCCSPATATSARWSKQCSARACACRWSRPSRPSRRWLPTNCAGRRTSSSISFTSLRKIGRDMDRTEPRPVRYAERRRLSGPAHRAGDSSQSRRSGLIRSPTEPAASTRRAIVRLCPRLVGVPRRARRKHPDWYNAPVPTFGPAARLLIVGLAPGLRRREPHRAAVHRRLGRRSPLRDACSIRLFGRHLRRARRTTASSCSSAAVTNAVRCVPPANKPTPAEIGTCRQFLEATIEASSPLSAIVALGRIAHESVVRALGARPAAVPFGHGREHSITSGSGAVLRLFDSYHCSRYNTNTGVLTEAMFHAVFARVRTFIDGRD